MPVGPAQPKPAQWHPFPGLSKLTTTLRMQENDEQKKRIEDLQKQLDEANAKAAEAGA
jgi:hypothetical protein